VPRRLTAALTGLLLLVAVAACGSDSNTPLASGDQTTTAATGFPVTLTSPAGELTLAEKPMAIVSLSPSATESLFAIGAGNQVVAVDTNSDYPPEVPKGDLDSYEPNVEAIAGKNPDLVVISEDSHDLVKGLTALKIPVLAQPAPTDLDGVYAEIEQLGQATGHAGEAKKVATDLKTNIDEVVSTSKARGLTYYYELDNNFYSQTSKTFLGGVLGQLGLVNIADGAGGASDYPQLSAEHIIKSNPDLILLADTKCCQQSAATLKTRPGWANLKAVNGNGVVELDDSVASRWGPRLFELVKSVAAIAESVATSK
jgi:iron complex transport system substrate-binding protein